MFGLIQGVANLVRSKKANKALNQLQSQDPRYQQSPYAAQQFGMAQNQYFAKPSWATDYERQILENQAGTNAGIDRDATDSSQALALKAATQGQTNQQFQNLTDQSKQYQQSMLGNLNNAYANMINEGHLSAADQVRRFGDMAQIQGAIQQNKTNALNGIFNGLNSDVNDALNIASFGMSGGFGGFGNLFGGNKQQQQPQGNGWGNMYF